MNLDRKPTVFIYLFGAVYGLSYAMSGYLGTDIVEHLRSIQFVEGILLLALLPFSLHLHHQVFQRYAIRSLAKSGIAARYTRLEPYTYSIFLLSLLFFAGIRPSIAFTLAIWMLLLLVQSTLLFILIDKDERSMVVTSEKYVAVLFLVSGFSALIYQVVWQRALFATFGINSESVTVIVSVFMFGLGVGALLGGYLQKKYSRQLLHIFLVLEIAIGMFGLASIDIIQGIGDFSGASSTFELVLWVYAILALPTLLMGATLPILVAFLQNYYRNLGKTVGLLYAFNTIGSAIAAFCTVNMLFVFLGLKATVLIAAVCNFVTAFLIYDASRELSKTRTAEANREAVPETGPSSSTQLPFAFIFVALIAIGYISLSHEILWFRLLGYMTANRPQVFGMLLAAFLAGVAWGALKSKKVCESGADRYSHILRALLLAAAIFYFAVPLIAQINAFLGKEVSLLIAYALITVVAALTGGIFPLLLHVGVRNNRSSSSESMSWLYFSNIIGATLGPLLTGFLLLDRFSLEANIAILTVLLLVLVIAILFVSPKSLPYKANVLGMIGLFFIVGWLSHSMLYKHYLERIQFASWDVAPFKHTLENKGGIITVEAAGSDVMYGNGIYDGRFNTDPLVNSNLIDRAFMIAAMHPAPKRILEIGLSTGSWTRVISSYAPLQEMVVVEINNGYPEIIRQYPEIATVLDDPKVNIVFDDGRRWLRNHPNEKFDFIVMNSTFHWRSNTTNLLSREFLELCKKHLNEGGVFYYNATGSRDVAFTAANVFKHVTTYSTFVAASDSPFSMSPVERKANLRQFTLLDEKLNSRGDDRYRQLLTDLSEFRLRDIREDILKDKNLWLITDDNMAVEYKVH